MAAYVIKKAHTITKKICRVEQLKSNIYGYIYWGEVETIISIWDVFADL